MSEICVDAIIGNINVIVDFVNIILEKNDCAMKTQLTIDIAIDELLSNIINYAYKDTNIKEPKVCVRVDIEKNPKRVCITFIDSGVPYNPLEKEDPDVKMNIEDRQIGGLGIYMVKKSMDDVLYEYKENKNMLTIIKNI